MIGKLYSAPPAQSLQWPCTRTNDDNARLVFVKSLTGAHSIHRLFDPAPPPPAPGNGGNPLLWFAKASQPKEQPTSQRQQVMTKVIEPRVALTSKVLSSPAQTAVLSQSSLQRHEASSHRVVAQPTLPALLLPVKSQTAQVSVSALQRHEARAVDVVPQRTLPVSSPLAQSQTAQVSVSVLQRHEAFADQVAAPTALKVMDSPAHIQTAVLSPPDIGPQTTAQSARTPGKEDSPPGIRALFKWVGTSPEATVTLERRLEAFKQFLRFNS